MADEQKKDLEKAWQRFAQDVIPPALPSDVKQLRTWLETPTSDQIPTQMPDKRTCQDFCAALKQCPRSLRTAVEEALVLKYHYLPDEDKIRREPRKPSEEQSSENLKGGKNIYVYDIPLFSTQIISMLVQTTTEVRRAKKTHFYDNKTETWQHSPEEMHLIAIRDILFKGILAKKIIEKSFDRNIDAYFAIAIKNALFAEARKRRDVENLPLETALAIPDSSPTIEEQLIRQSLRERIERLLPKITNRSQRIIIALDLQAMQHRGEMYASNEEVARNTGLGQKSIRKIRQRAWAAVRELLESDAPSIMKLGTERTEPAEPEKQSEVAPPDEPRFEKPDEKPRSKKDVVFQIVRDIHAETGEMPVGIQEVRNRLPPGFTISDLTLRTYLNQEKRHSDLPLPRAEELRREVRESNARQREMAWAMESPPADAPIAKRALYAIKEFCKECGRMPTMDELKERLPDRGLTDTSVARQLRHAKNILFSRNLGGKNDGEDKAR